MFPFQNKYVKFFTSFWSEVIYDSSNNNFEIGEICSLYKDWLKVHHSREKSLQDNKMMALIEYFYPKYEVSEKKYIYNISSVLWNKERDINEALVHIKKMDIQKSRNFYQMYELYCNFAKQKPFTYIVSKKYFENKLRYLISSESLKEDVVLETYWKS